MDSYILQSLATIARSLFHIFSYLLQQNLVVRLKRNASGDYVSLTLLQPSLWAQNQIYKHIIERAKTDNNSLNFINYDCYLKLVRCQ